MLHAILDMRWIGCGCMRCATPRPVADVGARRCVAASRASVAGMGAVTFESVRLLVQVFYKVYLESYVLAVSAGGARELHSAAFLVAGRGYGRGGVFLFVIVVGHVCSC